MRLRSIFVLLLLGSALFGRAWAAREANAKLADEMAGRTEEAVKAGALSFPKGKGLRIVSTGHSWVWPALGPFAKIAAGAELNGHHQRKHISGGRTGSANSIWLKEIGKYDGSGKARVVLLPAIATGEWDVMTWGVYSDDKPEYFEQWIEFCLKYNPKMVFYIQDAWTGTFGAKRESELTLDRFVTRQGAVNRRIKELVEALNKKYPGKVHVIAVGNSMLELLKLYYAKELPGIEGLSAHLCGKKHTLWSDGGHLGKGMNWWEGYCYYATIYKKSPELIEAKFEVSGYNDELDKVMRRCAWEAVINHPFSGVTDKNGNGIGDEIERPRKKAKKAG